METTRIFIASSSELENDRREFREFLSVENDRLHKMGHYLELIQWEYFLDSVSHERKQEDYNKELLECDILVCLFHTKAGKYTLEEFETGLKQFGDSGKPLIYTYFKEPAPPFDAQDPNSVSLQKFKSRLSEIGHFFTRYKNASDLKLHFKQQLDYLSENGLEELKEKEKQQATSFITAYFSSKNANYGNIHAETVQIGDTYINQGQTPSNHLPKSLTRKIPTISPENIIGREQDIAELRELLTGKRQVVLVNGIGGVGKTTLAQAYVHRYWKEYHHIAWIEQSGDDIQLDFSNDPDLRKNLEVDPETGDAETVLGEVLRKMKGIQSEPNLLVLDNADASLEKLVNRLPKAPKWHVLVTSREELDGLLPKKLDFLSPGSAFQLFKKHYSRNKLTDSEIRALIESVDYHTLTVEILAKTAMLQRYSFDKLQAALKDNARANIKTGRSGAEKVEQITSYLCSIFQISELNASERWLLQQFCLLPPEYHEFEILHKMIAQEDHKHYDRFAETAETLAKKGWLISDSDEDAFKMHRIIQEVVLSQNPPIFSDVLPLVNRIDSLLTVDDTKDNPIEKFQWIPFGQWLLDLLGTGMYPEIRDNPKRIELLVHLGRVYSDLGEYVRSKTLKELALNISLQVNGDEEATTARLRSNLAIVHRALGEYQEARKLLEKALSTDVKAFGEEHPNTAISYSNLALVLQDLGEYNKARLLMEKAVRSAEKNFGEEHPNTAARYSNLATLLNDLGEFQNARILLEKAVRSAVKNFGEEHPTTAVRYSNLATVLRELGEYLEARKLLEKAVRSDEKNFGEEHPNTAIHYSNLALVLQDLGEYNEARLLLEKAVDSDEKTFGKEHPNIAKNYSNLAAVLQDLGEYNKARLLLEKVVAFDEKIFGKEHPNTSVNYSNLASALQNLGEYNKARLLLEKAVDSDEKIFGEEHPSTAVRYSNLASVLQDLGEYNEARRLLEKAVASAVKNLGEEHPNTGARYSMLALVLKDLGEFQNARTLLEKAVASAVKNFGEEHPNTAVYYSNLALVLKELREYTEAQVFLEKAVVIFKNALPEGHPYIEQAISILEGIRKQAGK